MHRGTTRGAKPPAPRRPRRRAGARAVRRAGRDAAGRFAGSGISHDHQTETYIIVSGSGTLITGGRVVNGRQSAPDSPVTTALNGPSCSGVIAGPDVVTRVVKTGDIIIIPAGVPHGWSDIADHVDYLTVRPDPDRVLKPYVHPAAAEEIASPASVGLRPVPAAVRLIPPAGSRCPPEGHDAVRQ